MNIHSKIIDLKRQIEVASMIMERSGHYSQYDLAREFNVSEARIRRDIAALNGMGTGIYSRKQFYHFDATEETVSRLMRWYVALSETDTCARAHQVHSTGILRLAVRLNHAIRDRLYVDIKFKNDWKETAPLGLIYDSGIYILLAECQGETVFFPLQQIKNIRITGRTFDIRPSGRKNHNLRTQLKKSQSGMRRIYCGTSLNNRPANRLSPLKEIVSGNLNRSHGTDVIPSS